jgi:hypothetical protein
MRIQPEPQYNEIFRPAQWICSLIGFLVAGVEGDAKIRGNYTSSKKGKKRAIETALFYGPSCGGLL